jgi:hypothetical protein
MLISMNGLSAWRGEHSIFGLARPMTREIVIPSRAGISAVLVDLNF